MPEETAVLETPEIDVAGVDESADIGESTDVSDAGNEDSSVDEVEGVEGVDDLDTPDAAEEEDPNAPPPVTDGRKMPDNLKKAIAGIKATNPEAAKAIKGLYWSDQEYRAAFPKPADAVAAKNLIEEIGGQEGIQSITAEREEWNQIDQAFAEGKPDFVKGLAEGNPDAFLKTAPHVINEFAQRAPEQYQYYANNVAVNTLASAGLSIDSLAAAYHKFSDNPQAQAVIADVHNALVGLKEKATAFEQKRTDPREEQLKQREQQFEEKRRADFEGGIASQAEKYLSEKMQPELDRIIGARKVDPEAMKGYQEMVKARVEKMLGEIPNIANTLEAHYRTGDAAKSAAYIQAQYNRILPIAAKVIEPYLRNIAPSAAKPAAKTGQAGRSAGPGEVVLKEMPEWHEVDQSKTTVADLIEGRAILKNGKKASGWA
jgi:hypothetical protein